MDKQKYFKDKKHKKAIEKEIEMANSKNKVKKNPNKKIIWILVFLMVAILAVLFFIKFKTKLTLEKQVLENPLKEIIQANTNADGKINKDKLIEQSIKNFNVDYINYILISSGVNELHKSLIGYGNPSIEIVINDEIWNAEINDDTLITKKSSADNEDLKIYISKEQIIDALLSEDPAKFLKDLFLEGSIKTELMVSKTEILSKGYLGMY